MSNILEGIDIHTWSSKEVDAALNFLYGDVNRFFDELLRYEVEGIHHPTTQYLEEDEDD